MAVTAFRQARAAILEALGEPLAIDTVTLPEIKPGQVLVDLAYSGVCHTQLLEARGKRGPDRFLPHTLGHEGSGTVREVGPGVKKVKPGDRVVLTWIRGEGLDVAGTTYTRSSGSVNSDAISTFMSATLTCESRVVPIPQAMPLREAALLGCAVPTGAGILFNAARLEPGSSVAIFGVGGIGLSALLAADLLLARTVIAVDIVDAKLETAARSGATHTINAQREDPLARIREITGQRGVDVAIECAGRRQTMQAAFRSVRDKGGLCILAGNLPAGEEISIDPMDLIRGKRIAGTWGGETRPDRDIPLYADLYLAGKLKLDTLITHEVDLDGLNGVLVALEKGEVGRALVRFEPVRLES